MAELLAWQGIAGGRAAKMRKKQARVSIKVQAAKTSARASPSANNGESAHLV